METAFEAIKPGIREYELAAEIEYNMRRRGSEGLAFDTIVASGVRSAFPHGGCTRKKIQKGDFVVIDIGAKFKHYRADLTRTITMGKPSAKKAKIHDIVKKAQEEALKSMRMGVKTSNVDAVARRLIEKEEYGPYFVHNLGHGVGLEIHELPSLSPESGDVLKNGNTVTVEPGIYIVNFGGVRIEDTVLVNEKNVERLTKARYDFAVK
jgi:Xaa-Pro aminopeptidase